VAARTAKGRRGPHRREGLLKTIAVFKLVKALLLIAVGFGALTLLNPATAHQVERWATALAWQLGPRAVSAVERKLTFFKNSRTLVATAAFLYAALFAVEGVGLWMGKRWAEYLTIIATSSFVPLELYEIFKHATAPRLATLGINLVIVGYLIWKVRHTAD
jgi:uncharacterized membrane protein (DUF2068 family)